MKYMYRIRIIDSLYIFALVGMVHTHSGSVCICVCMCVSVGIIGTHLTEAACAWRPQVWRDNAEDGGTEINKEVTGVATGTRPTVFKWKTIRNPRPPRRTRWNHTENRERRPWCHPIIRTQHAQMLPCTCTHSHNIHQIQTHWRNHHRRRQVCKMHPTC